MSHYPLDCLISTSSNIRLGFGIPVVFFLPVLLLARCCPVVSWFMEIMALLGCCPPSSSMENRSSGTEHMLVSERTCKYNFQSSRLADNGSEGAWGIDYVWCHPNLQFVLMSNVDGMLRWYLSKPVRRTRTALSGSLFQYSVRLALILRGKEGFNKQHINIKYSDNKYYLYNTAQNEYEYSSLSTN